MAHQERGRELHDHRAHRRRGDDHPHLRIRLRVVQVRAVPLRLSDLMTAVFPEPTDDESDENAVDAVDEITEVTQIDDVVEVDGAGEAEEVVEADEVVETIEIV